ncbi:MAG: beta-ketoacyl-ACP synthase II [Fimbriimonas sp.]|nr:beta-ketoacyl-ACP synthase II [Fimbriimonas sp.]
MARRVVVTGIGGVTPLTLDIESTWSAIKAGDSGIRRISKWDSTGFAQQIGGEILGFCADKWMNPREAALCDPFLQYAVAGATMAIKDSCLLDDPSRGARTGTCIATAVGGMGVMVAQQSNLVNKGPRFVSPMTVPFTICDMASGYVSQQFKLEGPNHCLVSACASGASAVGEAYYMIVRGSVEAMVVGASDATVPVHSAAFAAARALSTSNEEPAKASRPFDAKRDGFVISEGSAVLVLEELEQARSRGVRIYGEVVGYGSCSDAYHMTAPDPTGKGAVRAMREAIFMASIDPKSVGYVNAHATSTPLGDRIEVAALRTVFGDHIDSLPVSGTKSMTGHMIGAAGSIEAIFCLLAFRDDVLPPTINQDHPDPDCAIDTIANVARHHSVEYALSNSFGFGGHNVSLLFRRWI